MTRASAKKATLDVLGRDNILLGEGHTSYVEITNGVAFYLGVRPMDTPVQALDGYRIVARNYMTKAVVPLDQTVIRLRDLVALVRPSFPPDVAYLYSLALRKNFLHWVVYIRCVKAHYLRPVQ
jgi:hypothetical protein